MKFRYALLLRDNNAPRRVNTIGPRRIGGCVHMSGGESFCWMKGFEKMKFRWWSLLRLTTSKSPRCWYVECHVQAPWWSPRAATRGYSLFHGQRIRAKEEGYLK